MLTIISHITLLCSIKCMETATGSHTGTVTITIGVDLTATGILDG